ncbi:MAG: guanylate kinase [Phycisphaeraceae bacterium]|nr:guanylate kinase [Phycisphaeraceae bacterium]
MPTDPSTSPAGPSSGLLLIISGPSGVGKTTITHAIEQEFAGRPRDGGAGAVFSVSATTRPRTAADREGLDYHFVDDAEFDRLVAQDAFLEWANVFGKRYGTLRSWVQERLAEGRLVILEIDVQGAISVKQQMPDAFGLFVLPPSENVLLDRLRARKREEESAIQRRFAEAKREMATARTCGAYDVFIVNDDLKRAIGEAVTAVRSRLQSRAGA